MASAPPAPCRLPPSTLAPTTHHLPGERSPVPVTWLTPPLHPAFPGLRPPTSTPSSATTARARRLTSPSPLRHLFLRPQSVVVIAQYSHSTLQALHNAITTLQHLFLSYPPLVSNHPAPSLALQPARSPLPYPAGRPNPTSAPCPHQQQGNTTRARRLASTHPAVGGPHQHQPQHQRTKKPTSREVEKSEIQEPNPLRTRTPHHPRSPLEQDPKHLCFWLRISPMRSRGRMCKKEGSPEDYSSGLPFWSLHSSPLRCGEHIDQVYEYWLISAEARRTH